MTRGDGRPLGATAATAWLRSLSTTQPSQTHWNVEIALDVVHGRAPTEWDEATATRFHIDVYTEEWGFYFCHGGRSSWIRVTDIPFVHGRDEFSLLGKTPALSDVGALVRDLEASHGVRFQRQHATIRTNLPSIEPAVRGWIAKF